MPMEILDHLFHPFTYNGVNGNQQDFSPDNISRVKKIASGSIVVGAVEAFSSSRSLKFSIITIGLTTLIIFYIAAAIIKMRNQENNDPIQPFPSSPEPSEPNESLKAHTEQPKKDEGETPCEEHIHDAQQLPPEPCHPQPIIPSSPRTPSLISEEQAESIPEAEGLPPPLVPSAQPILSGGQASSPLMDPSTLEKQKENEELVKQELPPPGPHSSAPPSPQLETRSTPQPAGMGEQVQKEVDKQKPSAQASPSVQVPMQKLYRDLPLTDEDAKTIHQIIEMIGSLNVFMIGLKTPLLIELGNKIQHVHPLKFLEKVLNTPELKASMIKVEDSTVKWKGFLWGNSIDGTAGFKAKCNRETDQNNFAIYIEDFCKAVNAPVNKVQPLVAKKDWEELVRFLIKLK